MSFGSPQWLWGLTLVPLLALGLWGLAAARRRRWRRLAHPASAARIDLSARGRRGLIRAVLVIAAAAMVFLALARPRWGEEEEEIHARGLDLIIALDLSRSMLAEDLAPSRLVVAKSIARELGRRLPSDRVGLIGFAGRPGMLCPMTLDRGSLELYLAAADPSVFPDQGTDVGAAIALAQETFERRAVARRILVILSDGEDQEPGAMADAARAREAGITIYTIGVGTPEGAPIPQRDENGALKGYLTDSGGNVITSRMNEASLAAIAEATGGAHVRATGFGQGVERVVQALAKMERTELADVLPVRRGERYRWPLAAAFLLALGEAALVERRRRR